MIRKFLLTAAAVVVLMSVHAATYADTVTLTGRAGTGVTAQISNYTLTGNQFCFTITNTSVAPGTTGTITNIGFNLPGVSGGTYTLEQATGSGNYTLVNSVQANATGLNTTLDFSIETVKPNGTVSSNFNGGFTQSGIASGQYASFCVVGNFGNLTAQQIAQSILARFQNVNNGGSDVAGFGGGGTPAPVPEPATMLLLGTGLAGVASKIRKRRKVTEE